VQTSVCVYCTKVWHTEHLIRLTSTCALTFSLFILRTLEANRCCCVKHPTPNLTIFFDILYFDTFKLRWKSDKVLLQIYCWVQQEKIFENRSISAKVMYKTCDMFLSCVSMRCMQNAILFYLSVCLSLCMSVHAGVVSKRMNISSKFF